jgi:sialate O-acetylesterase
LSAYDQPGDPTGQTWAYLREAQAQALDLPNTGMAVAIDIGLPHDIHPKNKQEVGRRLALIAKAKVYGIPEDYSGPVFESARRQGGALRVSFRYAETGLTATGAPLMSFEVAGSDRIFHPATAAIDGTELVIRSPAVTQPVAVRYAWRNFPEGNLFNGTGLPAAPFRSDDW